MIGICLSGVLPWISRSSECSPTLWIGPRGASETSRCRRFRVPQDVATFRPDETQRRVLRRGQRELTWQVGEPIADEQRVALYNRHKELRGLAARQSEVDLRSYREFLAMSCCDTLEIRYRLGDTLVGVAIADRASDSLSAVYCYYDPSYERLALGTYSVLKELELCRLWGLRYLYLGLYIAESAHMRYKAAFLPHERLLEGKWLEVTK